MVALVTSSTSSLPPQFFQVADLPLSNFPSLPVHLHDSLWLVCGVSLCQDGCVLFSSPPCVQAPFLDPVLTLFLSPPIIQDLSSHRSSRMCSATRWASLSLGRPSPDTRTRRSRPCSPTSSAWPASCSHFATGRCQWLSYQGFLARR